MESTITKIDILQNETGCFPEFRALIVGSDKVLGSYTTCPECTKINGKDYVFLFGRVKL